MQPDGTFKRGPFYANLEAVMEGVTSTETIAMKSTPAPPKMNNVETRWGQELKRRHPTAIIIPQFRLRVGAFDAPGPVHYTADFAVWWAHHHQPDWWHCVLWEVKDKRRKPHSDELVRAKMVRENNPFVSSVMLAAWDGSEWDERQLA
jgi:hypothetical protein